jgi:hypothetical protein
MKRRDNSSLERNRQRLYIHVVFFASTFIIETVDCFHTHEVHILEWNQIKTDSLPQPEYERKEDSCKVSHL